MQIQKKMIEEHLFLHHFATDMKQDEVKDWISKNGRAVRIFFNSLKLVSLAYYLTHPEADSIPKKDFKILVDKFNQKKDYVVETIFLC